MEQLILAAQCASQANLEPLASLLASNSDYFLAADPHAPHSVWTILLTLLPEAVDPASYQPLIRDVLDGSLDTDTGDAVELDLPASQIESRSQSILETLASRAEELGWVKLDSTDFYTQWLQIRIRSLDECYSRIDWVGPLLERAPQPALAWYSGIIEVINRYRALFPGSKLAVNSMETAKPHTNVSTLLQNATAKTIRRDFAMLVVPYLTFVDGWSTAFNPWFEENAHNMSLLAPLASISLAHKVASHLITACYLCRAADAETWYNMKQIHEGLSRAITSNASESSQLESLPQFTFESLLVSPLTQPTKFALNELLHNIDAAKILSRQSSSTSLASIVAAQFFTRKEQEQSLSRVLNSKNGSWEKQLKDVLVLRQANLFNLLPSDYIHRHFISAALADADFEFIAKHYGDNEELETLALSQFHAFFDTATHFSKTKGDMKHAEQCLRLLTSDSTQARQARALVNSANSLEHYTLSFSHGASATPAELRLHSPMETVHKILELNAKAYRDLASLIQIADQLVMALDYDDDDFEVDSVPIQVRAMCVESALVDNNFKVAYDYCVPVLSALSKSTVAWTACFQVGKYVSPFWDYPPLAILEQQMKILALTLQICPVDSLDAVLAAWKRNDALCREQWQDSSPSRRSPAVGDQSQGMSASRIARAISSSASEFASGGGRDDRPRKRDQISNLLVSSLGWAIGASQPR